jgi:hypothetical protein
MVYKILGLEDSPESFRQKIEALDDPGYQTIIKVCWRLQFIEQIENSNIKRTIDYLHYLDRLKIYLSTTCIDILTHENYESFIDWIRKASSEKLVERKLKQMISDVSNVPDERNAQKVLLDCLEQLYTDQYNPKMSISRAFRSFISNTPQWLQDWIVKTYRIEIHSKKKSAKQWDSLNQLEKCERIGEYLYSTRNIFTHRALSYDALDHIRRTMIVGGAKGYANTIMPVNEKRLFEVAFPSEISECDTIRLLLITWTRKNKLNIEDDISLFEVLDKNE